MTLLDDLPHLGQGLAAGSVVAGVHELLDLLRDDPVETGEYARLVGECERAVSRIQGLKLRLVAAAGEARVPQRSGAASVSQWLAATTRTEPAESSRQARLATDLCDDLLAGTRRSLGEGSVSTDHARVIATAVTRLPRDLCAEDVAAVEAALLGKARTMNPTQLRQAARRALEAVERDRASVDAAEDAALREEEEAVRVKARCSLHDNGDGTVSIHATVPTPAGAILKKILDQMASPRRARLGATAAQVGPAGGAPAPVSDTDWAQRRGQALATLIEHLPTDHLHGRVAASVIVKLDAEALKDGLTAAGLDTGDLISAAEARRLACNAALIPAVLDGASQQLDLGRANRYFTTAQRTAAALHHQTCAAHSCETPYAWCEAHHRTPWQHHGRTDLRDLIPLCSYHHQRIHDPTYNHRHQPDGTISFTQRT